jgi:hypothetical protein
MGAARASRVRDVGRGRELRLIAFRSTAYYKPLWVEPNFLAGRFNRAGAGPVQYFCLHPLGALAEALRWMPEGLDPAEVRRPVWAMRLPDDPVTTIGFDEARDWGIEPYALVCPPAGYSECQDLGETFLAMDDPPMLRVPSASLAGTWNLIVFGERVLAPYMPEPVDSLLDVPGALAGIDARALAELIAMIRPLVEPSHAAYEPWERGEPYDFIEPSTLSLRG